MEDASGSSIVEVFEAAAEHLKLLAGQLRSDDLLYFYARFKQATVGPCNAELPSMFDFEGRRKWYVWNELAHMPKDVAMKEYVDKLHDVDPGFADRATKQLSFSSSWVTISRMAREEALGERDKDVFDWVKEGNLVKVQECLETLDDPNLTDEDGLGLIHWAADRGFSNIVQLLIQIPNLDVNLVDETGQTPLHYACFNGHLEVAKLLLNGGKIDVSIKDVEGLVASETIDETDAEMLHLFS